MKKKLLFICANMSVGGFQKSLINLLEYMDYSKYDVDVLLINKEGIFLDYLNEKVHILSFEERKDYFASYLIAAKKLFRTHKYGMLFIRTLNLAVSLVDKGYGAVFMSRLIPMIDKEYDACIDYGGQYQNYYMIDKVRAKRKITYFHNDYSKWDRYKNADRKYYRYADAIVTVSDECVASMKRYFPEYKDKIFCIENIVTKKCLEKFIQPNEWEQKRIKQKKMIVTVARVCHDKGIDLAMDTTKLLKDTLQDDFIWIWVGPLDEKEDYKHLAEIKGLKGSIVFTGPKADPYSYMNIADVYVQPSRFEGKAVSIEEALILNIPVVATDFSTVHDQIRDGKNGVITKFDAEELKQRILELLTNKELNENIRKYQKEHHRGNENEINKLYQIIDM